MPTPGRALDDQRLGYRPALDGIRAAAIIAVIAFHSGLPGTRGGFIGVSVFFVLSGFLITRLLLEEQARAGRVSWRGFYGRRALRLFPALWALLAISVVVAPVNGDVLNDLVRVAAAFFYVGNWVEAFDINRLGHLGHTWSLAIEEQFYLLWPGVMIVVFRRWGGRAVVAVALSVGAASAIWRAALYESTDTALEAQREFFRASFALDTRLDSLLLGAAVAVVVFRLPRLGRPVIAWISAIGLGLLVVGFRRSETDVLMEYGLTVVAVASAAVIVHVVRDPDSIMARVLSWRPAVEIGKISYGLYLWHLPVFEIFESSEFPVHINRWPRAVLATAISFAVAWASYRWIESPALARKDRYPAAAAAVAD